MLSGLWCVHASQVTAPLGHRYCPARWLANLKQEQSAPVARLWHGREKSHLLHLLWLFCGLVVFLKFSTLTKKINAYDSLIANVCDLHLFTLFSFAFSKGRTYNLPQFILTWWIVVSPSRQVHPLKALKESCGYKRWRRAACTLIYYYCSLLGAGRGNMKQPTPLLQANTITAVLGDYVQSLSLFSPGLLASDN